ncbi:disease resistance protein RGA2-like [Magnolia sinica]|uniref:disease resistance protein RGA2-like n=1 Tax=Magnolia sinica TaxID=86752 RepID=UPI00265A2982|nr:disease resistance protein RGA2-like [Magnolia sinica]
MAQGFIGSDTSEDMEEIGGMYFDDLLRRSLLQDAEMGSNGNKFSCKMHDLVHDLAQSVAGNDCLIVGMTQQANVDLNRVHHSFIFSSSMFEVTSISSTFYKAAKLRTLLVSHGSRPFPPKLEMSLMKQVRISICLHKLFHHLQCPRTLEMTGAKIAKLPRTVGQLKHLRYINLPYSNIEEISAWLIYSVNLQTLILNACEWLRKLPREMRKMISLRHLELERTNNLSYLPRLSTLQTLTKFIVGGNHGVDGWDLGELKHLKLLQGSLDITHLQNVSSEDEAREAELYKKRHLHTLSLYFKYSTYGEVVGDEEKQRMEGVLEGLQPHTNLKELKIRSYRGSKFPEWMGDPSSNLIRILLYDCSE